MSSPVLKHRVYFCGGTGFNIGRLMGPNDPRFAFVDTGDANITPDMQDSNIYLLEGLHGAGSDRSYSYPKAAPQIPSVLAEFPGVEFNIVVFCAGGGSGSVIGPLLARSLLKDGLSTVLVVVGDDTAKKQWSNTRDTLKGLEVNAVELKLPVVMHYLENKTGVSFAETNDRAAWGIDLLLTLSSQNNHRLDTKDVQNWLQYSRLHPIEPQLSTLFITDSRAEAAGVLEPIAIASLFADEAKETTFGEAYSKTAGFPIDPDAMDCDQAHFVINVIGVDEIHNTLSERGQAMARTFGAYRTRKPMTDVDDNLTSDGLVIS
jgi:hypothetical protein